jgi:hypothetical protein
MLGIVLSVLKIIGIALLIILAVVLVLLLLVLFVPIRYKADLEIPETELDEGFDVSRILLFARFSWLLHMISGGIDFPEDKQFFIKLFGIKVFPRKKKKENSDDDSDKPKKKKKRKKAKDKEDKVDNQNIESSEVTSEGVVEKEDFADYQPAHSETEEAADKNEGPSEESDEENTQDDSSQEEDKALIEIIQDILDRIENFLKTPQNVFEKMQYTISRVCGKISMVKTTLESEIFKRAFALVKGKLLKIIKMILPDKFSADILLGVGDPATTAELLGVHGMLYPITRGNVTLEPDFERKVIGTKAKAKGHITIFTILYGVLVCYFNKDVKKVIRRFKKIIKS